MEKRYFSLKEASHYTGISSENLRYVLSSVRIRLSGHGSKCWYDKEDIDRILKEWKGM